MVLIDARRFSLAEYAANHPAGAIGRALILKVSDVMRTGKALALVKPTATVMEAALAMTKSHGGSAIVVDAKGRLKGIFTDGDFRRLMATSSDSNRLLSTAVGRVMTRRPAFIRDDAYAADLLKVYERRHIDDLPVINRAGTVVGVVDIQDLPKMKVM